LKWAQLAGGGFDKTPRGDLHHPIIIYPIMPPWPLGCD